MSVDRMSMEYSERLCCAGIARYRAATVTPDTHVGYSGTRRDTLRLREAWNRLLSRWSLVRIQLGAVVRLAADRVYTILAVQHKHRRCSGVDGMSMELRRAYGA